MRRDNPAPLAPVPGFPERVTSIFEYEEALNTRREGARQASEQIEREPAYRGAFAQGATGSVVDRGGPEVPGNIYERQIAPNARGRIASGQAMPTWDAVDSAMRTGFVQGENVQEYQATVRGFMHQPRAGANTRPLAPTWGFSAGAEVPGNVYQVSIAPANGGRARRNIADVSDR